MRGHDVKLQIAQLSDAVVISHLLSHSTGFITPWSAGDDSKAWQPPACRLVDCVADKRFSVL